jgi:hypothetical protein
MQWNLEEFQELCSDHNIPETTEFQSTLQLKIFRADFFSQKSQQVWDDLFSSHETISSGDEAWDRAWFEAEAYAEAALQALHSMGDVLAQIVNVVVLNSQLKEHQVSLKRVKRELLEQGIAPVVANSIQLMLASDEFKYTEAFVNTIKHRRLLDAQFSAHFDKTDGYRHGLRFKPFAYKQTSFPEKSVIDIINVIIPGIHAQITAVGNELSDHLR